MGNPLINELLVGTGFKDRFSVDEPKNDSQFADFFLDPALARVINALTNGAVAIPPPPRTDLLPVVTYAPPIAAPGTPAGPIADLLRLNVGVLPTPGGGNRLGLLGGDAAGFPNGRRVSDDVTDAALRLVVGGVLAAPFPGYTPGVNDRLGDGVNVNDAPYRNTFPYLADAPSGRDRRHANPGDIDTTPPDDGDGTPTLSFSELGADPAITPVDAVAWRIRNPEIGHVDGPFALPGYESLMFPVAIPCASSTGCVATSRGGTWATGPECSFPHLHGPFEGHADPAPGPPQTVSGCGHGGIEWGRFSAQ
jgi:hypothetical protein